MRQSISGSTLMAFLALLLLSALLAGCGGSKSGRSSGGNGPGTPLYSIGGTISGLDGTIVLQNSGGNNLSRSTNGAFTFTTSLAAGSNYAVTVLTQPSGQTCSVANGSGTVGSANVGNVTITCTDNPVDPARSNASLDSLTLSVGALDQIFQPNLFSYTSTQPFPVANLTVTPTAAASGATITVNGVAVTSGNASQSIAIAQGSETAIAIAVTSADSSNTRTYTVAVTRQAAGAFAQQAYIKASNAEGLDQFGWSVALSGDTLVVGTPFEDSGATGVNGNEADNGMFSSGAVYVFVRNGATWAQQAYLKASNTGAGAHFGFGVAVSGDTLVVGAPGERSGSVADPSDESAINAGAVYVFERSGTTWSEQAYLKASNIGAGDRFGWSVALSLSGDTLAAGATGEGSGIVGDPSDNSAQQSGAAYVFVRNGTNWTQQAYIKASNPDANDEFGTSIALSGDTLAVGAPFEDSAATGIGGNAADNSASSSGAAYIFVRSGTTWSQQAYIKASNTDAIDQFGASIALFGNMLAVGAPYESSAATGVGGDQTSNNALRSGAVYVFVNNSTSWTQQAYIKASNTDPNDMFGGSVALSYTTLAVGARYEESRATGVGGDETDNSTNWNGAVYVYTLSGTTWAQRDYVKASNTGADDEFGASVALAGGTLAVGAINEDSGAPGIGGDEADDSAPRSGAVYVYVGPVGS